MPCCSSLKQSQCSWWRRQEGTWTGRGVGGWEQWQVLVCMWRNRVLMWLPCTQVRGPPGLYLLRAVLCVVPSAFWEDVDITSSDLLLGSHVYLLLHVSQTSQCVQTITALCWRVSSFFLKPQPTAEKASLIFLSYAACKPLGTLCRPRWHACSMAIASGMVHHRPAVCLNIAATVALLSTHLISALLSSQPPIPPGSPRLPHELCPLIAS